jgi:hypothetical protein
LRVQHGWREEAQVMIEDRPAREKRRLPQAQMAWMDLSTTPLPDDVKRTYRPGGWFRRDYVWADGFQALADITRPGEQVAAFALTLYEKGSQADISPAQKDFFLTVGATFDMLSVMVPGVMAMKSFGTASELVAKALRNETVSPSDIMNMNNVFRNVMDLRASPDGGSIVRTEDGNVARVAPKQVLKDPERVTALYFQKAFDASSRSIGSGTSSGMLAEELARGTVAVQVLPLPSYGESIAAPDEIGSKTGPEARGGALGAQSSEVMGRAVDRPDKRRTVDRTQAGDMRSEDAQRQPEQVLEPQGVPPESGRPSSTGANGEEGVAAVSADTSHGFKDLPAPLDYALVDGIPLCLLPDEHASYSWQQLPLAWYRAAVVPENAEPLFPQAGPSWARAGTDDGSHARMLAGEVGKDAIFTVNSRDYVTIDGHAYAVRNVSPFSLQVYKPTDVSLPPLPVEKWNGAWRFKPLLSRHRSEIGHAPGVDGYIRVNNKKYLIMGNKVIQTQRARIVGEERIAHVAQAVMEPLPGAGACGFIQWTERKTLIEGRLGYYLVHHDAKLGMVVQDAEQTERFAVHYDYLLGQWRVGTPHGTVGAEPVYQGRLEEGLRKYEQLETMAQKFREQRLAAVASHEISMRRDSLYDWRRLDEMPFTRHWPSLAPAVPKALQHLARRHLTRANRRHPAASTKTDFIVYSIENIRDAGYRLLPAVEEWNRMSLQTKQQRAAAYTADIYDNFYFLEANDSAEAMCSEMTELAMIEISRIVRANHNSFFSCQECNVDVTDVHFLAVQIMETVPIGRTGRAHVALLAFKTIETMEEGFGPITSDASADVTTLKQMQNGEFRRFVMQHKDELILIDAWGPNKVIDFSGAGGVDAAIQAFEENLREASFGDMTATVGFSVKPFVPPLSGTRARHAHLPKHQVGSRQATSTGH